MQPETLGQAPPLRTQAGRARRSRPDRHPDRGPKHGRPAIKQSDAVDPVAKWTCSQAFRRATTKNGREFLGKVVKEMPFEAEAIQIDGGSEFKAEFETECEARGFDLWVLPPKSPELNGCVERTNGTWR